MEIIIYLLFILSISILCIHIFYIGYSCLLYIHLYVYIYLLLFFRIIGVEVASVLPLYL